MTFTCLENDADTGVLPDFWLTATSETIAAAATMHHGACDEGDLAPDDLEWKLMIDLPLGILIPLIAEEGDWRSWFDAELAMFDEEHPDVADGYRSMMDEPLNDPIVVTIETERVQIWDGWHRTATRILGGATTIPAIVGRIPGGSEMVDLIAAASDGMRR